MKDLVKKFLLSERRKRITQAEMKCQIGRKAPSLRSVELRYNREIQKTQLEINRRLRELVQPLIKATVRQDAEDDISTLFARAALEIKDILNRFLFSQAFRVTASSVAAVNDRKYDYPLYNKLGINALPSDLANNVIDSWVKQNTDLITNVNDKQLFNLQRLFRDNAFTGTRSGTFKTEIDKIFRKSRKNAALIARDQVQKLGGQLDEYKQRNAGIDGYYWRSSRDERVRASHADREGQYFRWDSPPSDGHPGQAIGCRCDAEPALDRAVYEGKELKEALRVREEEDKRKRDEAIAKSKEGTLKRRKPKRGPVRERIERPIERRMFLKKTRTGEKVNLNEKQQTFDQNARRLKNDPKRFIAATKEQQDQALQWNWVHGSNRKVSIWMKQAAKKEFGLHGMVYNPRGFTTPSNVIPSVRKSLRRTYEATQNELRKKGIKTIRVYRGVKGEIITPNTLSSWTTDINTAKRFGGNVIVQDVPVEKVLNFKGSKNWADGLWGNQHEVIIME